MPIHPERRHVTIAAALAGLYALGLHGHLVFGPDQAQYVVLGEALASGRGYRQIQVTAEPLFTRMPPGLPLGLALAETLDGPGLWLHHALVLVLSAAAPLLAYRLAVPVVGRSGAFGVATLTALNATFFSLAHQTLSEGPYTTLSLAALLALRRTRDGGLGSVLVAALTTGAAVLVRTVGIALLPAGLAVLLTGGGPPGRRLGRACLLTLVVAALVVPWTLSTALGPEGRRDYSYFDLLRPEGGETLVESVLERAPANAAHYLRATGDLVLLTERLERLLSLPAGGSELAGAVVLAAALLGLSAPRWGTTRVPVVAYLAGYAAIQLSWFGFGTRMLAPVLPLILLAAWKAGQTVTGRSRAAARWLGATAGVYAAVHGAAIAFLLLVGDGDSHRGTLVSAGVPQREFLEGGHAELWRAAEWAGARAAPGDLIVSRHNQLVYLAAARQTLPWAAVSLRHERARFVLLDALDGPPGELRLRDRLRAVPPPPWRPVAAFGSTVVLGRPTGSAPLPSGAAGRARSPRAPREVALVGGVARQ